MDPLQPRLVVVKRRDDLPVAERPVGAAHSGVCRANDHPDHDESDRCAEERGERASEALHVSMIRGNSKACGRVKW